MRKRHDVNAEAGLLPIEYLCSYHQSGQGKGWEKIKFRYYLFYFSGHTRRIGEIIGLGCINERNIVRFVCVTVYPYTMMVIFCPQTLSIGVYLVMNTNSLRCNSFHLKALRKVCLTAGIRCLFWCTPEMVRGGKEKEGGFVVCGAQKFFRSYLGQQAAAMNPPQNLLFPHLKTLGK